MCVLDTNAISRSHAIRFIFVSTFVYVCVSIDSSLSVFPLNIENCNRFALDAGH